MVWVIATMVIFALMAIAKLFVDKAVSEIECPTYFPKRGSEFKANERVVKNAK